MDGFVVGQINKRIDVVVQKNIDLMIDEKVERKFRNYHSSKDKSGINTKRNRLPSKRVMA